MAYSDLTDDQKAAIDLYVENNHLDDYGDGTLIYTFEQVLWLDQLFRTYRLNRQRTIEAHNSEG